MPTEPALQFVAVKPLPFLLTLRIRQMADTAKIDQDIDRQAATIRTAIPTWVTETIELAELAGNAERAAASIDPRTADRSRKLIVEVAEWQQKLSEWQGQAVSARLSAELRILKATLDAAMDEANSAARSLHLLD